MRTVLLALLALASHSAATAGDSAEEIIIHCASLASGAERLACFDAVVALTHGAVVRGTAETIKIEEPENVGQAFANVGDTPFHQPTPSQFYLGGSFSAVTSAPIYHLATEDSELYFNTNAASMFVGMSMGESSLFGIEGNVRTQITPVTVFEIENGTYSAQTTLQELISGSLSFRVGQRVGDLLLYGRVGGGISQLQQAGTQTLPGTVLQETERKAVAVAVAAAGVEFDWGAMFTRAEAEMRHFTYQPCQICSFGITTFGANLGAGFRF